jgi:hypothetical protein
MKYALVIVSNAEGQTVDTQALRNFANSVLQAPGKNISKNYMLNAGAWLIPLGNGLHGLSDLVEEAKAQKLLLRTLIFDDLPAWIVTNP